MFGNKNNTTHFPQAQVTVTAVVECAAESTGVEHSIKSVVHARSSITDEFLKRLGCHGHGEYENSNVSGLSERATRQYPEVVRCNRNSPSAKDGVLLPSTVLLHYNLKASDKPKFNT